ncbi:MAG: preprotein translocase subunit SecY [Planctomycetota bacterium]|nr:preprotein translocase subunit SecY [Planctomycetota bacterium]
MLRAFLNIWRIPELRAKVLFTFAMLGIYRLGYFIALPGVNQKELADWAEKANSSGAAAVLNYINNFTGGTFNHSTIFGLGIMPYISASIIFQLLATVWPSLKELQKEGPSGQQKIQEWTRYATVPLCIMQGIFWIGWIESRHMVYADYAGTPMFWICGLLGLTAGSVFLMWIGEQIDKFGIGNGVSLIISAGIVSRLFPAILEIKAGFSTTGDPAKPYGYATIFCLLATFVIVVAGSIVITQGQRRIPIQQAKHTRGTKVVGGQRSFLPLRVNHGGVMPIIFASSLMVIPTMIFNYLQTAYHNVWIVDFVNRNLQEHAYPYLFIYIGLIYFFAYFWTTVQFNPTELATNLRDHGHFIPGMRPGPRTAEYLEVVMERITYVGAGFLAVIAVIPTIVAAYFKVSPSVAGLLGGTGLLIVVSVMLDFVQRVEAGLMMRNYQGFLGKGGSGKGPRMRGRGAA